MAAIDTNVAIAYLKEELRLPTGISEDDFLLPVTVAGEMLKLFRKSGFL